ncbi:MAG: CocE/NonD family hydrolase [Candidatus Hydrogenedentota bacterium]
MKKSLNVLLLFVVACAPFVWAADDVVQSAETSSYMAPMRDGVKLATAVNLPEGAGPFPTIVVRTPYNKEGFSKGSKKYTDAGYAYVAQDCRGRFASEGSYEPFATDREDGYDTIAWIKGQSFCNGKIGITGGSAMGITANMAAASDPPGLAAAYVVVAPQSSLDQMWFTNGAFKWSMISGWMKAQGADSQVAGLLARPVVDDGWMETDLVHHIQEVDIPMYNVGGWYDIFLEGNIDNFVYLQEKGKRGARGNQKLLMGPFGHGQLSGDLEYVNGGRGDNEMRWFAYWLKAEKNGIMDEPAVSYYMMASARKGALSPKNDWRQAESWPPQTTATRLYLTDKKALQKDPLEASAAAKPFTEYKFDPHVPVPTIGGSNLTIKLGPMDQRAVGERDDYLRFQTAPIEEDVAIAGKVTMELWASTDGPDTDFMVKLVDVYPDGYEALVLDNPMRARFRHGRNPQDVMMMRPNEPELLTIDLWSTAITFEKGHRIAVHVTSSNYPRFDVNPNTGVPAMEARVALNRVYHEPLRPSAIVLPVLAE